MTSNAAARYQGAAGSRCSGSMKKANVSENSPGPISMAMPRSDAMAPCNSPCSEAETRRVISDCDVDPASDQSELTGIASRNIQVELAHPYIANPAAAKNNPVSSARRSPSQFTIGPTSPPDMMIEVIPTTASEMPTMRSFQC